MVEEQETEKTHLPPSTNRYARLDEEISAKKDDGHLQKRRRIQRSTSLVVFAILLISVIALCALFMVKFRTPKFRIRSATFDTFSFDTSVIPSFNIGMDTEFDVKNTNFGHFRYENTTVEFYYRGIKIGEALVRQARVSARSTWQFDMLVNLSSANITVNSVEFALDFSSGIFPLSSTSRMRGNITVWKVFKNNKSTNMNCTMNIVVGSRQLQNIKCT